MAASPNLRSIGWCWRISEGGPVALSSVQLPQGGDASVGPGPPVQFPALLALVRVACVALEQPRVAHRVGSHRLPPRPLTLLLRGLSSRGPKPACVYPSPCCVPLPEHTLPRKRHLLATFCLWICQPWPSPP